MRPGTAQSFLETALAQAIPVEQASQHAGNTSPTSGSCQCCCRCGRAEERKLVSPTGKPRSRSYSPLRAGVSELLTWEWQSPDDVESQIEDVPKPSRPGEAPLESLPTEILGMLHFASNDKQGPTLISNTDNILGQLALDVPPAGYTPRNIDLMSCLLTSRTMYAATITVLYRHITIPHSLIFSKFLSHVSTYPALGSIVKRLDLSHFTSVGLGRTGQSNFETQNLTSRTLLKCLTLSSTLREVLLQEHLDHDVDEFVLRKLFFGLPTIRAIDFCALSSSSFVDAFTSALEPRPPPYSSIKGIRRLSLHECFTLPAVVFEILLPLLPQLTHLDIAHTRVNDKALASISPKARLTHLNIGRCTQVSGSRTVDLLTTHPAFGKLVYLNLSCDVSRYRLLWEVDIERLLPILPLSLRSLNLSGAKIHSAHVPLLIPLTKHLEELSIGHADLSMKDINSFFVPTSVPSASSKAKSNRPSHPGTSASVAADGQSNEWIPSTIHYLDLTAISGVTQSSLFHSSCSLLSPSTMPLEVLELGDKPISALRECKSTNRKVGWVVRELGRRGWYVREAPKVAREDTTKENGKRAWKMGAMWWGMRKVPVAYGEVGGLYGHYMFKK
ncbi:hypothetical protein MMC09_006486 [Bachmanniomyces sp. S44760]|nr:hypothetical protein [Bachmanniomyces sp. S44760]